MSTLAEILQRKLIPWSRQNAHERFIVAQPKMSEAEMPSGVRLVRRKITSTRRVVKNLRLYKNTRGVTALWPEAGLNEVNRMKLICVFDGYIDYQLGNYAVQCGPGHFIFVPPRMPHPDGSHSYVDTTKSTFCDLLFFHLHPGAVEWWIRHYDEQGPKQAEKCIIMHERVTALINTMMQEVIAGEENSLLIGAGLLPGLFMMLQREIEAGHFQMIRSNAPQWLDEEKKEISPQGDFTTRLERYVRANLHKPLTLENASRDMLLSRTQFIRMVRQNTGKSFHEILIASRVEEAKVLLRDSQWTVVAIAYMVGFKSPSHFRTFFRKHTGQTPTAFRMDLSQNTNI